MQTLTKFLAGGHPGPGESTFKLYWSEYHKRITELSLDILGPAAMTPDGGALTSFHADLPGTDNDAASWVGAFYNARSGTIYAGNVPGAAQHHRRTCARPPQGTQAVVTRSPA